METPEQVTETPDMSEHFEQTMLETLADRIDRDKGEIHGVRIMGIKSNHGYEYSLDAQRAAAPRYEQMPCGLDHDYSSSPMTIGDTWGVLCNPRVDDKGTLADIKYLKSHARTAQILEDAERNIGLFSLSAVTTRVVKDPTSKIVKSFSPVRVDLVTRGATTRTLFEQAVAHKDEQLSAQAAEIAELKSQVANFEQRLTLHEQYIEPKAVLEQTIQAATKGIDLKAFWNTPTK